MTRGTHYNDRTGTLLILGTILLLSGTGAAAPAQDVFQIEFSLSQDHTVDNTSISVVSNEPVWTPGTGGGPYRFTAFDEKGDIIYYQDADISFYTIADPVGVVEEEETSVLARLPFVTQATEIQFSHDGTPITTFSLPDHLCSSTEDGTCSPYCDGKAVDPDCGDTSGGLPFTLIVGALLVIALAAAGVYMYRKRKAKQKLVADMNF